jgi:hypothetical protein
MFKKFVDLVGNLANLGKPMFHCEDMENLWTMFDHVKRLFYWILMAYHVYNNRHYMVLTIACSDMQIQ